MRKNIEKVLFYYSLMAITILFFTSVFFAPTPQNFISLGLLIPLIIYFWLRTTSPKSTTPNLWSIRIIAVMLILSLLGIISFSLGGPRGTDKQVLSDKEEPTANEVLIKELISKVNSLNTSGANEDVTKELSDIKKELARISGKKTTDSFADGATLGKTTDVEEISKLLEDIPYGFVTISNPKITELDVLDNTSFSSRRVGIMEKGQNYEFFEKTDGWYLVKPTSEVQGWVNERDVKEVYQ